MKKIILEMKHFPQTTDYTCGPSSVLSFLHYYDKNIQNHLNEKNLAAALKTNPIYGTHPDDMFNYLSKKNSDFIINPKAHQDLLFQNLKKNKPAIVLWYAEDEWHWSNVLGLDKKNIILLDPLYPQGLNILDRELFNENWFKLAIY